MKSGQTVRPFFRNRLPGNTINLVPSSARIVRTHLKAGGKNNAIYLVLLTVKDDAVCGNLIYPFTVCIHQRDIG